MPCVAARSRTVSTRIDPVKCRCRWALGRSRTERVMRVSVSPAQRSRPSSGVDTHVAGPDLLLVVLVGALVVRDEAAGAGVAHLAVAEPVVLGVDRVGVV